MDPVATLPEASEPVPPTEPVPSTYPGGEDVVGLRIAAALIDLVVLGVLSVVLSVTIGEASMEGGRFSWSLNGAAEPVFWVLVFLYFFGLETIFGRTVGKLLLGLQVVDRDGGRPSVWAAGIRTVLRVVDWLPLLYLVGFVVTLVTGTRRQRVGDLAAKTSVARALPIRRRGLAAALVASGLVVAVVGSVVSVAVRGEEDRDSTYRAHGVSFNYPAGWRDVTDEVTFGAESGGADELWTLSLGTADFDASGVDMVTVTAYRMRDPVTAQDMDAMGVELTEAIFPEVGWAVQAGPEKITMGGKPGLSYEVTGSVGGTDVESTLVYVFDDLTEYELQCQSTPEHAAEIEQGCDQIIRTFEISEADAAESRPTSTEEQRAAEEQMPVEEQMPAEEQMSAEERWLDKIVTVRTEIDEAFLGSDPELTTSVMVELETALRACSRELAATRAPTARLEPVYTLVEKACQEYDKGAECFATAAQIGIPVVDSPEDRMFTDALDCGFDAQGRGGELLVDAEIKGFEIQPTPPG